MKTFSQYVIAVNVVLAAVLAIAWIYASGEHLVRVSLICYGFLLGYLQHGFTLEAAEDFVHF
jgi:hypothetical protein